MSEIKTNKISPRKGTTQTIGDSGDTLSIACGATLSNAGTISTAGISGGTINNSGGTISGLVGVINWDTTAKTTGFTAVSNTGYFVNTTSGQITITLPASPTAGDVIAIKDYANTFDTNKAILNANGNKIQGSTTNFDVTVEGTAAQFIYVDATRGWVLTDASKASDIAEQVLYVTATGGTISTCGDYKIHAFTGPGTFCVSCAGNALGSNSLSVLTVAGGGGGRSGFNCKATGGGGGGGGAVLTSCYPVSATAYPITIGGGGALNTAGSNSTSLSLTAIGGGRGGVLGECGSNSGGGSGGGGGQGPFSPSNPGAYFSGGTASQPTQPGVSGTDGFGSNGGRSQTLTAPFNNPEATGSGGGGGGGSAGSDGTYAGPGGNGGSGKDVTPLFGAAPQPFYIADGPNAGASAPGIFAGGGGGGGPSGGSGGTGGGGNGGSNPGPSPSSIGKAGIANTGGGGGGGQNNGGYSGGSCGGAGGSGIVLIKYKYQN